MNLIILSLFMSSVASSIFSLPLSEGGWVSVDDRVMGGVSQSYSGLTQESDFAFVGELSLENNGGFASIRRSLALNDPLIHSEAKLKLSVLGDGRTYQVRFRTNQYMDGVAYMTRFATTPNETLTYEISLDDFKATWRGRRVPNAPKLQWKDVRQIGFMVADKQPGEFGLLVKDVSWF